MRKGSLPTKRVKEVKRYFSIFSKTIKNAVKPASPRIRRFYRHFSDFIKKG
jgi:hypothetical protein